MTVRFFLNFLDFYSVWIMQENIGMSMNTVYNWTTTDALHVF